MQHYQDIWINGVAQTRGIRDCERRYQPIQAHCRTYNRPITILDIGANLGYYSFRLSSAFDCTSVMIEGAPQYQKALLDLVKRQKCRNRLILLGKRVDLDVLRELSKCEHFDVVLAMRVVHHFQEPFAEVVNAIVSLGDSVFFELPTADEDAVRAKARVQNELADHSKMLANYKYDKVGEFPIHVGSGLSPMYLVEHAKVMITRPFYGSARHIEHSIESTFDSKRLIKVDPLNRGDLVMEWVPGINLYTYHALNGLFPDRRKIARQIKSYALPSGSPLTDIRPWNFVLHGNGVALIDHTSVDSSQGTPFNDDPQHCLFNTAFCILARIQPLQGFPYNRRPQAAKMWLLRRTARELPGVIKGSVKRCCAAVREIIDVLVF